ncbi:MAG: transporter permease [Bacteroidota bacterium]|nr:transporter permease [Bacteroidota bacterium]
MTNQAKVGIFTAITIAIFVLGFYFLKGINLFQRKNKYYAIYERVDGLYKSNLVEINGFPIGRVGPMERNPENGKIVVELDLDKNVNVPKSDSTVALLVSTDFLGSKKVRLVFGKSTEFMQDGDTISTYFKKDLTEQLGSQIDPIMIMVKDMLPAIDSTIAGIRILFDVNNPKSIFTTIAKANDAITKVDTILGQNQQTLQLTIKNLESITANIEKNNGEITVLVKNASSVSDSLQQANIKQTIENLNGTITQLKTILNSVNEGKGTLGKLVKSDDLYSKVDSTIGNMNSLLKDVKARPYRYVSINVLGSKKAEQRRVQRDNEMSK